MPKDVIIHDWFKKHDNNTKLDSCISSLKQNRNSIVRNSVIHSDNSLNNQYNAKKMSQFTTYIRGSILRTKQNVKFNLKDNLSNSDASKEKKKPTTNKKYKSLFIYSKK